MAVLATVTLWALVGLAAAWDVSQRRIPNGLILTGLLLGLGFQAQLGGLAGLGSGAFGALVALLALILPFALHRLGGGDVKIAMVCGAFLGWRGAIHVILIGMVVHALIAVGFLVARAASRQLGRPLGDLERVPHAVGFAIATISYCTGLTVFF